MKEPSEIPQKVIDAVCKKHAPGARAKDAATVLRELRWDGLNGCYFYYEGNVFVGVETDGHVHT